MVSAAAVGGGLWWAGGDPEPPGGQDDHSAAPTCASVPEDTLAEILPGAVLETDDRGPVAGGEHTACVWTTLGETEGDRAVLRVDLSARFTDATVDPVVTGDQAATAAHEAVVPVRGEPVDLPGSVGAEVWRGQLPGTAELAFHTANLLVRVSYTAESEGDPVTFTDARDTAVEIASRIGADL
ncbi:hypothetical protein DSY14_01005 [Nocardiopsis sp. MG754419]|nr:hypothetical protein [Nocardiopsis sp. MG754419]MBR8740310.1 hypothetical protein [Nocardiopsis sp. MG754419]